MTNGEAVQRLLAATPEAAEAYRDITRSNFFNGNGGLMTNLRNIYTLFETAVSNKLKYPKIRLRDANGNTVVLKLSGNQSKYCGQIQITNDARFHDPESKYFGRIDQAGNFHFGAAGTPAVIALLEKLAADPAGVASEYGKLTGNCCFCGLPLTDPQSTAQGYGPICAAHYGLPWGKPKHVAYPDAALPEYADAWAQTPAGPECFHTGTVEQSLADPSTLGQRRNQRCSSERPG